MGPSSDQLEHQIVEVRGSMEAKIVELRERGRRASRTMLVAAGVAAGVGVVVLGAFVAYRLMQAPTAGERFRRLLPPGLQDLGREVRRTRRRLELGLRRQVPPMRLYIGDRRVGEEPAGSNWERIAVRAAQAAATAAAGAFASRILSGLASRGKSSS
jgi:hypothetical protein